ncbi:hypothetical protein [Streptomyces malaysiense]|uniref:hypothetical protein n=1 Tax=Streptomyces malaysiense TaxID=1428626 RepID=UPI000ADA1DDE|nr:hypothetical protein [Streptomyces malaysiense]
MSTGLIILLVVIVALLVVAALVTVLIGRRGDAGPGLKRRFGPEYERAVAAHDGDTQAAERELNERVERHGDLRERPLAREERDRYTARWTSVQEHFVESPRQAVAEADQLLGEIAAVRGYPDGGRYDEQLAALSVHHADHVDGYRRIHRMAGAAGAGAATGAGTEEMRSALVGAHELFDDLTGAGGDAAESGRHRAA